MIPTNLIADSVDQLVKAGIAHIRTCGAKTSARGLSGLQAYNVNYILTNPFNRVHTLRAPKSIQYFARELLAYCSGSLLASELAKAAPMWGNLADKHGNISSNYGYYTFYQKTPDEHSQYEWVASELTKNLDARRCVIVIDHIAAKITESKDIPCTIGMHFFVESGSLSCVVSMRSTDIVTGLPYDMGFYSFVLELLWQDVRRTHPGLALGYCMVKSNLTQLYDNREKMAYEDERATPTNPGMPHITNSAAVLADIYHKTQETQTMQWLYTNSNYET